MERRILLLAAALPLLAAALGAQATINPYPAVAFPIANPPSPVKIALGKMLFWEEQMSSDNTIACGTCHHFAAGGTDPRSGQSQSIHPGLDGAFGSTDDVRGSMGVIRCFASGRLIDDGTFFPNAQVTPRFAPSVADAMFATGLFWDGRAGQLFLSPTTGQTVIAAGGALENLALQPTTNAIEMAAVSRTPIDVSNKVAAVRPLALATNIPSDLQALLAQLPNYPAIFNVAFGPGGVTPDRIAFAIASYLRSLTSNQTPYDSFIGGQSGALTLNQQTGLNAMRSRGCTLCHVEPLFTNNLFLNNGLSNPLLDSGRQQVTGLAADLGKMKVPSLRNVGLREPFGLLHAGNFTILDGVLIAYEAGGLFALNRDPVIQPIIGMTPTERAAILDFMRNGLTDPRMAAETAPFDRPTLASEAQLGPLTGGTATVGGGAVLPQWIARQPALPGANFTLGIAGGTSGALSILALTTTPPAAGTVIAGIPLYIAIDPPPLLIYRWLEGVTGFGEGFASATFALPNNAAITGVTIFGQWFVLDPYAPTGFAATNGLSVTVLAP